MKGNSFPMSLSMEGKGNSKEHEKNTRESIYQYDVEEVLSGLNSWHFPCLASLLVTKNIFKVSGVKIFQWFLKNISCTSPTIPLKTLWKKRRSSTGLFIYLFLIYLFILLYNIVLVLPYINLTPPWVSTGLKKNSNIW